MSRTLKQTERAAANEEWLAAKEPRLSSLESEVVHQASSSELVNAGKLEMESEMAELRKLLAREKEKNVELRVANNDLNLARDEVVASRISMQEELEYCQSEDFKKKIMKISPTYHEDIGREASSFLDKGCIHIIRQLHPYFEDKSILLQAFKSNFDNEFCRQGALRERDGKRGRTFWKPPQPSSPTFWDMFGEGSNSTAPWSCV